MNQEQEKRNAQTREAFRIWAVNDRKTYDKIRAAAVAYTEMIRETIDTVNVFNYKETGVTLIDTDADKLAAIEVMTAELQEVANWELVNKHNTRQ